MRRVRSAAAAAEPITDEVRLAPIQAMTRWMLRQRIGGTLRSPATGARRRDVEVRAMSRPGVPRTPMLCGFFERARVRANPGLSITVCRENGGRWRSIAWRGRTLMRLLAGVGVCATLGGSAVRCQGLMCRLLGHSGFCCDGPEWLDMTSIRWKTALNRSRRTCSRAPTRSFVIMALDDHLRLSVDLSDHAIGLGILRGGFERHERQFSRESLRPGDAAIDLGANIGFHAVLMADASV